MSKILSYMQFTYKGKRFFLYEADLSKNLPGVRYTKHGIIAIMINKNLDPIKRSLELHRLIKGRGLRLFNVKA